MSIWSTVYGGGPPALVTVVGGYVHSSVEKGIGGNVQLNVEERSGKEVYLPFFGKGGCICESEVLVSGR